VRVAIFCGALSAGVDGFAQPQPPKTKRNSLGQCINEKTPR
jgi:hypothetical protein